VNSSQINCFLEAAECLNFTKAAERLYLSQPGLSRQIATMEREIGINLFERGRNSIQLTAAGTICVDYLSKIRSEYKKMLDQAAMAQRIKQDSLIIGCLEGQLIGKCYENVLTYFWTTHPNIRIKLCYFSVSDLCKALVDGEVDIAIMPEAEAARLLGILFKRSHMERCYLVVPRNHPKADTENPTLQDFQDETFLVLADSESDAIARQHQKVCQAAGFTPKQRIVPTFGTLSMLLEMGVGISVLNVWHSLHNVPHLKFLNVPGIDYQIEAVAWHKDNKNPNIPIFISKIELNTNLSPEG
jgi:DNA-binding transcriptional LysR family regulator